MSQVDYEPLTGQLGIAGTSYGIQIGLINRKWAIRLLKGKSVIDVFICKDEDIEGDFPNQDKIINWVLRTIVIPNINPLHIRKTVQILLKQAKDNKDKKKIKAPVKEAMEIKLKEIPSSKLKIIKNYGWVKENKLLESNKELKLESEGLGLHICPYCDFKIVNCPNCGKGFIKTS